MLFTVVTIIFVRCHNSMTKPGCANNWKLPLSFFCSVFGMNAKELNDANVGLVVILPVMCE